MKRGPKPISLARVKHHAWVAAKLLFLLRRGRKGVLFQGREAILEMIPVKDISPEHTRAEIEAAWKKPKLEAAREKLKSLENGFYSVEPPVNPASELWAALKRARSEREIKNVADEIAEWDRQQGLGYTPARHMAQPPEYDFVRVLRDNARSVLKAKHLPEYPKSSKRPSSDNKRVWFFAKVLAGLMLGWSPLYVLKRLSRWHGEPYPELKKGKRQ